jgi:hypothetical protein
MSNGIIYIYYVVHQRILFCSKYRQLVIQILLLLLIPINMLKIKIKKDRRSFGQEEAYFKSTIINLLLRRFYDKQ